MIENALLCILLYLMAIVSPGQYTVSQIEALENQHEIAIQAIHSDPPLEQAIVIEYSPEVEFIGIIDGHVVN